MKGKVYAYVYIVLFKTRRANLCSLGSITSADNDNVFINVLNGLTKTYLLC